jgi:hypothetical protein
MADQLLAFGERQLWDFGKNFSQAHCDETTECG